MACDALSLEVLSKSDGLPKLSERELWACLAYLCANSAGLNSQTGEVSIASFKLAQLDERSLLAVFLGVLSMNADAATLMVTSSVTDKMPAMSERDLLESIVASAISTGTASTVIASAMAAGMDQLSRRDLLAICVAAFGVGTAASMLTSAYASGYTKLSERALLECIAAAMCARGIGNLVPGGSKYGPGAEFDLVVSINTQYQIMWGANDLSMTLCGVSYPSLGNGQTTIVNTGACALMQFFGTFAGTTVTAMVRPVPVPSQVPVPTGFTWVISGGNAVATWDAPPPGVVNIELWTSANGTTYTLAGTTTRPATTLSVTAPGAGALLYAEIRFSAKGFPTYGAFTSALVVSGDSSAIISAWAARVIVNGGAALSNSTQTAHQTFVSSLIAAGVWSKMWSVNTFAPDNLIATTTAILSGVGVGGYVDPWANNNFVAGDLSVNGLVGDGATKFLRPCGGAGLNLSSANAGATVYAFTPNSTGAQAAELGYTNDTGADSFILGTKDGATDTKGICFDLTAGLVSQASPGAGYYSLNRIAANDLRVFFAKSNSAHAQLGATFAGANGSAVAHFSFVFAANHWNVGPSAIQFVNSRLSFVAFHQGLTAADSLALYNAVQALRTALGGGFV